MFSNKVTSIGQSPIREFAPIQEKRTKEGTHVYQLNIGQPDIVTPKEFFSAVRNFDISIFICYIDCSPRCTLGNRLTNNRAKIVTKGYGR